MGGVRVDKRCWWRNGKFPLLRDGRFANRPYGAYGESGMRGGLVVGGPRPAPLWIPAFAGTTMGGIGVDKCCWWRNGRFPLLRDGRFANRPYGAFGESEMRGGWWWWGLSPGAPLDTGFRRYDDGVCGSASAAGGGMGGSRCCGTGGSRTAPTVRLGSRRCDGGWWWGGPPLWIPAFAGTTMGGVAGRRVLLVAEGPSTGSGRTGLRGAPTTGCGGGFLLLRGCGRLGRPLGVGFLGGCLGSG